MIQSSAGRDVLGTVLSGSVFPVSMSLLDDFGIDPDSVTGVTFSLFNEEGEIVNSREDIPVAVSPEGAISFNLLGADLPQPTLRTAPFYLTLQITVVYLSGIDTCNYIVENLILVNHRRIAPVT